jgi:hypothetical protein
MKLKMKSSSTTRGFSIVILIFYGLYSLFSKSLLALLLSFSVGLIFYGVKSNLEMSVGVILLSGILISYIMKRTGIEGFEDAAEEKVEDKSDKSEESEESKSGSSSEKKETSGSEDLKKKDKAGFADINPAPVGQFKLGEIPKEEKGGFFIDQGTTLMSALNGLKPAQINAMTNDTKQLIETQKSLMGMLNTLAPMMKEGSSLLNMFNGMFGKQG